jgi:hypothetical protein
MLLMSLSHPFLAALGFKMKVKVVSKVHKPSTVLPDCYGMDVFATAKDLFSFAMHCYWT